VSIDAIAPTDNSAATALTETEIFDAHQGGKLSVTSTVPLSNKRDLSIAYTPGVADVSRAIHTNPELAKTLTWAQRLVVVVSDGTAVLGLGNIGAAASLPVMEGKSALFKTFGELDSIPLVLNTTDVDEIVETLVRLRPSFGAVNLEDISAPRCFELEEKLIEALDCPVMHDDQHGTAVVALAALTNAAKVTGRELEGLRVVVSGAGAAGIAVAEILLTAGIGDVVLLDSKGVINRDRADIAADPQSKKSEMAQRSNPRGITGGPGEALLGADVFIGVSSSKLDEAHLKLMNADSIVFALSNPDPEVLPEVATKYAAVVATGRSDFPNQINNVLAFPGIFRGALDAGARRITPAMKLAAARAIAELAEQDLSVDYIVPSPLDPRVAPAVTAAVAAAVEAE
jgi:malate dehydrogenase (oxaloacetate-decarboxylating)